MGGASWTVRLLGSACLVLACACSKEISLGKQCPSPYSGNATVKGEQGVFGAAAYGTSCAPCKDAKHELDDNGCPIYVTPAYCGEAGLCLFGLELGPLPPMTSDGGMMQPPDEDAGVEEEQDAGAEDDGGGS